MCTVQRKRLLPVILSYLVFMAATASVLFSQSMEVTVDSVSHKDKSPNLHLKLFKQMGATSIQTYIHWNEIEKEPGTIDWSKYDSDVELFKKQGLKWIPFLIVGPWYVTPEFVRQDKDIVFFRCLEHGLPSGIISIWCPRLRDYVRGFLKEFSDHYSPIGIFESINLGISGDYGEAIYPAVGNWPTKYHSHPGFWCGDALATADFRRTMNEAYRGDIGALNKAWKSHYRSFEEVKPFLPQDAPSSRARLEFIRWYRNSMTRYAEFWLGTARELFPTTEIYLCVGGDMAPENGSDFSAQAKLAAKYGAGIRITNDTNPFPQNFRRTGLVDSACRFYGAYFGHEPGTRVDPIAYLGRIFGAITSGARQLFFYNTPKLAGLEGEQPVIGQGGRFQVAYKDLERVRTPIKKVALLYPTSSLVHPSDAEDKFAGLATAIRGLVDYDFCDERMVQEGALTEKTILIAAGANTLESATLDKIQAWVSEGGLLFMLDSRPVDWDGNESVLKNHAPEGSAASSRALGQGKIFFYSGSADGDLQFLKNGLMDCLKAGLLREPPLSLVYKGREVYLVDTTDGLFALNMSPDSQKAEYPGGSLEIAGESIKFIPRR